MYFADIRNTTLSDRLLTLVMDYLVNGWPPTCNIDRIDVSIFHNLRHELEVVNDVPIYRAELWYLHRYADRT